MKRIIVRCVVAGAFVTGVSGVGVAAPDWSADLGLDFWNVPQLNSEIDRMRQHSEELDQQTRSTMRRLAAKADVMDELHRGELTLREAAARFRNLNTGNPIFAEQARLNRPACSDDECQYWNVIDSARCGGNRYVDRDQFVSRLTAEFQGLQRRGETRLGN
jgi:hypothetical protein